MAKMNGTIRINDPGRFQDQALRIIANWPGDDMRDIKKFAMAVQLLPDSHLMRMISAFDDLISQFDTGDAAMHINSILEMDVPFEAVING